MSLETESDLSQITAWPIVAENHDNPMLAVAARVTTLVNRAVTALCMLALLASACILTYGVVARDVFQVSTDWEDEAAVFLLFGAVFLTSAYVQSQRSHIGIEVLRELLPVAWNRVRMFLADLASLAFCSFFAWKSWTLLAEAVHGGYTTESTWAAPLWIPYSTMALGMSLLCVQIVLQLADRLPARKAAP